jgi:hypothetical protein
MADIVLHDTYFGSWSLGFFLLLVVVVLILSAGASIKYHFFR